MAIPELCDSEHVAIPELCDSEHKEILYFEFHKSQIISSLVYIIFLFVNKTLDYQCFGLA